MILNNETFTRVAGLLRAGTLADSVEYAGASGGVVFFQVSQEINGEIVAGYHLSITQDFKIVKIQRLRIYRATFDKKGKRSGYETIHLPLIY
jgi:hypothetical protein